jgi:hypothetical protein
MSENELNNIEPNQEVLEDGSDNFWLIAAIVFCLTTIGFGIKDFFTSRNLKQEQEKNKLYQEALKKHQAQINELKNEKERREYRDRLWAEIQAEMEE